MPRAIGDLKVCAKCTAAKSLEEFYRNSSKPDGRASECRECRRSASHKYLGSARRSRAKEGWNARQYRYRLKKYGLTVCQYARMRIEQNDQCAICGEMDSRSLSVDHCHETGRVRGLLCSPCNLALGCMRDDPARLTAAIGYLRK